MAVPPRTRILSAARALAPRPVVSRWRYVRRRPGVSNGDAPSLRALESLLFDPCGVMERGVSSKQMLRGFTVAVLLLGAASAGAAGRQLPMVDFVQEVWDAKEGGLPHPGV